MNERMQRAARRAAMAALVAVAGSLAAGSAAQAGQKATTKAAKAADAVDAASGPLPANAAARVNDVVIPQADVDAAVRASNTPDTPALRTAVKNQLIARELFRQAAEKQHYERNPKVIAFVEQAKTTAMMQAYLQDNVKPAPVTDADVKARFDAIVATLGENEWKPSVIAVKDAETAGKVLDALKKGGDFAQLAKQYSQGPAAQHGGALDWISFKTPITAGNTQNWPQPLAEALVKLPQGGVVSAPVQVGDAYWIVRADQKRATQVPSFDQTKDTLRKQLEQVAVQKATAEVVLQLVKGARIQQ